MLVGPVFTREAVTAPRRARLYAFRAGYVAALFILMCTVWLVLAGTQLVRNVGDLARFGAILFQILAPVQLALGVFFSALLAASAVALEKDRRTLVLLLLTNLSNSELVLGKLLASMLSVLVLLAASLPLFMLTMLFGGVAWDQLARALAVTLASALAAGSLGSTLALWREKTFQSLALTALALVFWLVGWEAIRSGVLGASWSGISAETWAASFSPWQAILEATRPRTHADPSLGWFGSSVNLFLFVAVSLTILINAVAIGMVRVWNPSREHQPAEGDPVRASIWGAEHDAQQLQALESAEAVVAKSRLDNDRSAGAAPDVDERQSIAGLAAAAVTRRAAIGAYAHQGQARGVTRQVWDNPVIWREIRTWAYGRKILMIRLAYIFFFALALAGAMQFASGEQGMTPRQASLALVPLAMVSLILINAQAVTALTSERDASALDLLLVTELTPKEFVFGKLGGVLYNTKEMVLLPIMLGGYLAASGAMTFENFIYLTLGMLVMDLFVAVLGIHAGMMYGSSRTAISVSLGTVFFLFVGVATCMWIMVVFSGSFRMQLQPFLAFIFGGGAGMYFALGARNPSPAILVASLLCPFATFYAITSFLLGMPTAVILVVSTTYAFTTAAMLIPAIFEFDVATGRTSGGED